MVISTDMTEAERVALQRWAGFDGWISTCPFARTPEGQKAQAERNAMMRRLWARGLMTRAPGIGYRVNDAGRAALEPKEPQNENATAD